MPNPKIPTEEPNDKQSVLKPDISEQVDNSIELWLMTAHGNLDSDAYTRLKDKLIIEVIEALIRKLSKGEEQEVIMSSLINLRSKSLDL